MGSNDHNGWDWRLNPRPSAEAEQDGGAADRTRFQIQRFAPEDSEDRHEYYGQFVISRKAVALIVFFLTVVTALVDTGCRLLFPV
jgi:hypothetical protein